MRVAHHNPMLRIQKSEGNGIAVFALSGRFDEPQVSEIQQMLETEADTTEITLDLEEVRLVDREAVRFLAACEARGIILTNCSLYIREWIGTGGNHHES